MPALPSNVSFGDVTGRFVIGQQLDSPTTDVDAIPAKGVVTFTPSVPYLRNELGKVTVLLDPIRVPLEAGALAVRLIATDDTDLNPVGWTYTVSFLIENGTAPRPYSISVPVGSVQDLVSLQPVASASGTLYLVPPIAEKALADSAANVTAAAESRDAAEQAAARAAEAVTAAESALGVANAPTKDAMDLAAGMDVATISSELDAKADAASVTQALAAKASTTALDSLATTVTSKADAAAVTEALAAKASTTALTALATDVSKKAADVVANPGLTAQPPTRRRDLAIDVVTEANVPTDGTTAAQNAIATGLLLAGGRRAILRKGTYRLTARIDGIPQGTVIEGEPGTVILVSAVAMTKVSQSDVLWRNITFRTDTPGTERFLFSTTADTATYKNWRFERCVFDGVTVHLRPNGAMQDTNVPTPSWTGLGSGVEFRDCETTNTKSDGGIWIAGCDDVLVDNHYFHDLGSSGTTGEALKVSYGAKGARILHSRFVNCSRDAIDLYDAVGALVDGNEFRNVGVCAVEAKRLSTATIQPVKHRIVNNRAVNCATTSTGGAISVFTIWTHYVYAAGNTVEASPTAAGFRFGGAIDNVAGSPQKGGILIGNTALGCGGNGFNGNGTVGATIIGNYAEGNGGIGFAFPTSANASRNGSAATNVSIANGFADQWA